MTQTIEEAVTELIQKVSQLETKVAKLARTGAPDEIQAEEVKAIISEIEGTSELVTTQAKQNKDEDLGTKMEDSQPRRGRKRPKFP